MQLFNFNMYIYNAITVMGIIYAHASIILCLLIVTDSNTATITIATTVPMSILTIVAIISVVAIVWIGLKVSTLTGILHYYNNFFY